MDQVTQQASVNQPEQKATLPFPALPLVSQLSLRPWLGRSAGRGLLVGGLSGMQRYNTTKPVITRLAAGAPVERFSRPGFCVAVSGVCVCEILEGSQGRMLDGTRSRYLYSTVQT